jgi:HEAT repeat protein
VNSVCNIGWKIAYLYYQADQPLPAFIEALNDEQDSVRGHAAFALGRYGPMAAAAIPSLTRIAADEKQERPTREAAKTALIEIGPGVSF